MNPDKRKLLSDNGAAASSKYNEDDDEDNNNEEADEDDDLSSNHVDVSDYINMMCNNFAIVESFDSKDSSFSQDSGEESREFVVGFYDDGGKEKFEMLLLRKKDLTADDRGCPNGHPVLRSGGGNNEECVRRDETFPSCSCVLEEYNELVQQNNSKCFDEEVSCESEDESQTVAGNDIETKEKDTAVNCRPEEYNSLVFAHNTEQFDEAEPVITSDGEVIDETVHDGNHKCNRQDKEVPESDSELQMNHDSSLDEKTSSCCEANPAKASYPSGDFGAIYVPISKITVEDRSLDQLRDKSERQGGSRSNKSKSTWHPSAAPQGTEVSDRVAVEAGFEDTVNRFDCWKPRHLDSVSDYSDDSRNASMKKYEETGDYISAYSNIERNPLYFQAMTTPNSVKRIFPCYNLMPCDNDVDIEPPLLSQSHSGLRHRRRRKDVEVTISNEVPDYMGDRDVEEVLLFIYGKESQNALSSKADPKSSGPTGKADKKKKKRKHHQSKHNKNQTEKPDQSGKYPVCDKDGRQLSDHVNLKSENKQEKEHCSHVVPDQVNNFSSDGNKSKQCKGGKPCKAEAKGCGGRTKKKKAGGKIDAGSIGHLPQQPTASHVPFPDCDDDFLLRLSYLSEDEKVKTVEQNFTLVANKKSKKMSSKLSDKADDCSVTLSNKPSSTRSSGHLPNNQSSYASFKLCSSNDSVNTSTGLNSGSNDEKDCRGSQPTLANDLQSTSALRVSASQDATTATAAASKLDNGQTKKKAKELRNDVQKSSSGTKKQTKQSDGNKHLMKISNEVQSCPAALDYTALDDIVLSSVICESNGNEAENRSFRISGGSETSSTNSNVSLQQRDRSCSPSEMPIGRVAVDSIQTQPAAIPCACSGEFLCSDHGNSAELGQNFCRAIQDASSDSSQSLQDSSVRLDAPIVPPDKAIARSSFRSGNRVASLDFYVSESSQLQSKEPVAFSEFQFQPENVLHSEGAKTSSGVDLSIASSNATMTQGAETPGVVCYPAMIFNGDLDDGVSSTSSASPIMGQKKPVVFLDTKQVNARSHDMGITFGFDANAGDDSSAKSESLSNTSLQSYSVMQSYSDCLPCDCADEETSEKTDSEFFLGGLHQNGYRVPHLCKPTYLVYPNGHLFSGAPLTYIPYIPFIPPGMGFSPHMGPPVGVVPPMIIRSTEDDGDGDDVIGYKMNLHDGCGPHPGNLSNDLTSVELASSMPMQLPPKTAEAASVHGKTDGNYQRFNLSQAVRYVHREYEKVLKKVTQGPNCPVVWYSSDHDN